MKLSKTADFAMRMVIHLARESKPETLKSMASTLNISYHNLTKLAQQLTKQGILNTKQGKNGGVTLAIKPDKISIRKIIDIVDGPTSLAYCLAQDESCKFSSDCKLKEALSKVQKNINQQLDEILISKLI